ncbi:MAG TPA: hypothetical protein VFR67_05850 [Pilimelia sp.]|nr:hypothetical protein [Pilimelia sp.]
MTSPVWPGILTTAAHPAASAGVAADGILSTASDNETPVDGGRLATLAAHELVDLLAMIGPAAARPGAGDEPTDPSTGAQLAFALLLPHAPHHVADEDPRPRCALQVRMSRWRVLGRARSPSGGAGGSGLRTRHCRSRREHRRDPLVDDLFA